MKIRLISEPNLERVTDEISAVTRVYRDDSADIQVTAKKSQEKGLRLSKEDGNITIEYERITDFCRALGLLGAFAAGEDKTLSQKASFETLGYMPDCSRNAVLSVSGAKDLLRHLAAMGFNMLMLYTEDTYEIPEYPYFGHLRGRFTKDELKEIDRYALSLGIELIPCIQVLAHLNQMFKWNSFKSINDTADILNIAKPETYDLIDAMLRVCEECFTSKRINLGMDEAHNLGRGKYLETTGAYKKTNEIMHEHLEKVINMANAHGFEPMMWSDMFFRPLYGGYYTTEGSLPDDLVKSKPDGITPIYWDYYCGEETCDNMMRCHEQFGCDFAFAGGAWKWIGYAPDNTYSLHIEDSHLRMCKKHNVKTVFTTGWGDKGGEAGQLSVLPALMQYAEYCYNDTVTRENLAKRFEELFDIPFDAFLRLDLPNRGSYTDLNTPSVTSQCKYLLYNDPLIGMMDKNLSPDDGETYAKHTKALNEYANHPTYGYLFRTLSELCNVLELKATLSYDEKAAYKAGDKETLYKIANERIPEIIKRLPAFINAFREQWYKENKTFGFEVQEQYLGGLMLRLSSTADRLNEYLDGKVECIEELEAPSLDYYCREGDFSEWPHLDAFNWQDIVSASRI